MNIEENNNNLEVVACSWIPDKAQEKIVDESEGAKAAPQGTNEIILPVYAINPLLLDPNLLEKLEKAHKNRPTKRAQEVGRTENKDITR